MCNKYYNNKQNEYMDLYRLLLKTILIKNDTLLRDPYVYYDICDIMIGNKKSEADYRINGHIYSARTSFSEVYITIIIGKCMKSEYYSCEIANLIFSYIQHCC